VADRDIIWHENVGLWKAVFYKKKKRKREKVMHLFDKGETEGQGRFFSPVKIARIWERTVVTEDA
jgi:hypothetical protein